MNEQAYVMQQWWNGPDSGKPRILEERAQDHHKSQTKIWDLATGHGG